MDAIEELTVEKSHQKLAAERRKWVNDCTGGERSPIDQLTDCERAIIEALMLAGYELTGRKFRRQIIRREAA